jgi:hypothetical protein
VTSRRGVGSRGYVVLRHGLGCSLRNRCWWSTSWCRGDRGSRNIGWIGARCVVLGVTGSGTMRWSTRSGPPSLMAKVGIESAVETGAGALCGLGTPG